MTWIYNLILLAADVAAWRLVRAKPRLGRWFAVMLLLAAVAVAAAIGLAADHFEFTRLLAWGMFLHGAGGLLCSAAWVWPRSRLLAAGCGLLALALWVAAFDAFLVEPTWLQVTRLTIESEKITRPLRIVVVADLQTDDFGPYERDVLKQAIEQKPDILLLAGDYVQVADWKLRESQRKQINAYLREIKFGAPGGAYAIQGNVDSREWYEIFAGLDVTACPTTRTFELDQMLLTCLSLGDSFHTGLTIENHRPDKFHLVLGHVPNFALGHIEADLLVAGHTHGGQVRFPLIGPIITHTRVPRAWAAGTTELPSGATLVVSRGIGMERDLAPPMRFFCRPELVVIELAPKAK